VITIAHSIWESGKSPPIDSTLNDDFKDEWQDIKQKWLSGPARGSGRGKAMSRRVRWIPGIQSRA
jgi:hypothetical protein